MVRNIGDMERLMRALIGLMALCAVYVHVFTGLPAIVVCVLGVAALITGLVGYCALWTVLRINTCRSTATPNIYSNSNRS